MANKVKANFSENKDTKSVGKIETVQAIQPNK